MKTMVKTISLKVLLVFATFFITLLLLPKSESRAQSTASLSFSPSSLSTGINRTFTVNVVVNTGGSAINGLTVVISYPTNLLQYSSIGTPNSHFVIIDQVTNTAGIVNISLSVTPSGDTVTGTSQVVVPVTFMTRTTGSATLAFTADSIVMQDNPTVNILGQRNPATITITTLPNSGIIDRFDTIFVFIVATLLIFVGTGAFMQYRHDHNQLKLIDD